MSAKTGVECYGLVERLAGTAYDAAWGSLAAFARPLAAVRSGYWRDKVGMYPPRGGQPHCWIHGCSLGEVGIALKCVHALRARCSNLTFTLSTVTPEGYAVARAQAQPAVQNIVFFPFDARASMRRAFDRLQPEFIVLCEVELWPNHLLEAARRGVPVFVVNGRLTEADERNYRRAGHFMRRAFAVPHLVCARGPEEASRFKRLGAREVVVTGDMKYDSRVCTTGKRDESVLLGASTHDGEEEILVEIFAKLRRSFPRLRLVIVPRHPARATRIRKLVAGKGFHANFSSRGGAAEEILIVDQVGALAVWYGRASVCFVGKSLTARGGQNFLEAAAAGCPIVAGPHLGNFAHAAELFLRENAMVQVKNASELHTALARLLGDPAARELLRLKAQKVLQTQIGATERTANLIVSHADLSS